MKPLFYLRDTRTDLGSNSLFWKEGNAGYVTNLNISQVYTLEEAQRYHDSRNTDIPLLKSRVDRLSISAVDMQVLPKTTTKDPHDQYCIQYNGKYNGNDIAFLTNSDDIYNYNKAEIVNGNELRLFRCDAYSIFSKEALDKVARSTFQTKNINKRTMCTIPGIKLVRPKRSRATTGKTRGNCVNCGKLVWDYNPFEPMYCDSNCIQEAKETYKYI